MRKGRIIEYELTIVEGDSLLEIGQKLQEKKFISADAFNSLARDRSLLSSLNISSPSIEGYLFPETYKMPKGARPADIIKLMVGRLRASYTDEMKAAMLQSGWSENDVLTLASIIEKRLRPTGRGLSYLRSIATGLKSACRCKRILPLFMASRAVK